MLVRTYSLIYVSDVNLQGALLILLLYAEGWSVDQCSDEYQTLTEEVFSSNASNGIVKWLYSLLFDAMHSTRGIETALKRIHGNRSFADSSYLSATGTKLGILTASVPRSSVCLFTNYNGVGKERKGYEVPCGFDAIENWRL